MGQKLDNRSPAEGTDYVQEAKQAEAERDSDDAKIEKPLADQMVREGYLSNKHKLEDRAVDHTNMSSEYVKEASEIGVKEQVRCISEQCFLVCNLFHAAPLVVCKS